MRYNEKVISLLSISFDIKIKMRANAFEVFHSQNVFQYWVSSRTSFIPELVVEISLYVGKMYHVFVRGYKVPISVYSFCCSRYKLNAWFTEMPS